jgi:S-adenosylmethionine:tRNA ribosyltransferase-isomerase
MRQGQFFILEFNVNVRELLEQQGEIPLPPYIDRKTNEADQERYQTIYAENEGAVAAPTAGLHFDDSMFNAFEKNNIKSTFITLHVGAGTFQPVRVENIKEHEMHAEYIEVSKETCDLITKTQRAGGRIIAVGTTSVRSLETAAASGEIKPFQGDTDIFIYPGYKFKVVNAMITNFHLPESTLLMLISAFADREMILKAYEEAVSNQYRFFSYGDAMFISKE